MIDAVWMRHRFSLAFGPWSVLLAAAFLVAACSDDSQARRRSLGDAPRFADVLRIADAQRGGRLFGPCAACHSIREGGGDKNGPALFGVVGKPVAGNSRRFAYTGALRGKGGIWTPERLDAWLTSPAMFAPGTRMTFPGIPDALDRADLIAYLQAASPKGRSQASHP